MMEGKGDVGFVHHQRLKLPFCRAKTTVQCGFAGQLIGPGSSNGEYS